MRCSFEELTGVNVELLIWPVSNLTRRLGEVGVEVFVDWTVHEVLLNSNKFELAFYS